ncbi:hypothetical protein KFU94_58705 [Chloroflexi bacterium TSY]|nr:hypothetical protein [Chloroflexi bacterium TSY]
MAWWNTQLIFQGDTLIAEGVNPLPLDDLEVLVQEQVPPSATEQYTRIIVSGYALYSELRGYYALGVAHWNLDRTTGRAYMTEASQNNREPISSLTPSQRTAIRECLTRFSPEAWEASLFSFRKQLDS